MTQLGGQSPVELDTETQGQLIDEGFAITLAGHDAIQSAVDKALGKFQIRLSAAWLHGWALQSANPEECGALRRLMRQMGRDQGQYCLLSVTPAGRCDVHTAIGKAAKAGAVVSCPDGLDRHQAVCHDKGGAGAGSSRYRVPFHPEMVRDAVRVGRGAGAFHGIHRWPPIGAVGKQDDLWHLFRRDQRRTEARDRREGGVAMPLVPDIDEFEERAAIMEYDGGLSRSMAEDRAAQEQGFRDAAQFREALAYYLHTGRLGGWDD
ncbi:MULTISPECIES: hypothetical protein [Paracoccus]|nr:MULTISPECIES: hypothetical protein [Paracoccus]